MKLSTSLLNRAYKAIAPESFIITPRKRVSSLVIHIMKLSTSLLNRAGLKIGINNLGDISPTKVRASIDRNYNELHNYYDINVSTFDRSIGIGMSQTDTIVTVLRKPEFKWHQGVDCYGNAGVFEDFEQSIGE